MSEWFIEVFASAIAIFINILCDIYGYVRGFFTARGESVLVIGGSKGIGWGLAKQWAKRGAKVLVAARWNDGIPEHLPQGISTITYNVKETDRAEWFLQEVLKFFDGDLPKHIIFNVGFSPEKEDAAHFEDVIQTLLIGNGLLMKLFAERWQAMGEPICRFYGTSSYVTFMKLPNCHAYRAAKAGLESSAITIRVDFPGLLVFVINPGVVRTDIWGIVGLVAWMKSGLLMLPGVSTSVEFCAAAIYWFSRIGFFRRILPTPDAVLAYFLRPIVNLVMCRVSWHGSLPEKYQRWLQRKWWPNRQFHKGLHWCLEGVGTWAMNR